MSELVEIWQLPFMQRAIIGGVITALLLSWVGVFAVLRKAAFYGDALSHAALAGVAGGLVLGLPPLIGGLVYVTGVAFIIPVIQKLTKLNLDSILGILLPFSLALGVVLLATIPGYQPDLITYLFGNILTISWQLIGVAIVLFMVSSLLLFWKWKELSFVSYDPEYAQLVGVKVQAIDIMFNILMAVAIVISINLIGIILIGTLLIIPATIARLLSKNFRSMFIIAPIVSLLLVITGIHLSFFIDAPTGPVIALLAGTVFAILTVILFLLNHKGIANEA